MRPRQTSGALRDDSGYTLSELLIVASLTLVLVTTIFMVLQATTRMSETIEARSIAAEESRMLVDGMTREFRQAVEIDEGEGVFDDAQPRRCSFYTDLNHDGVPERVTYSVRGKTVYRSVADAQSIVPPYQFGQDRDETVVVRSLKGGWNGNIFTYYDHENPPGEVNSGHPEDVSAIKVWLVNSATSGRKTAYVDSSTWVKIRSVHNTID